METHRVAQEAVYLFSDARVIDERYVEKALPSFTSSWPRPRCGWRGAESGAGDELEIAGEPFRAPRYAVEGAAPERGVEAQSETGGARQ